MGEHQATVWHIAPVVMSLLTPLLMFFICMVCVDFLHNTVPSANANSWPIHITEHKPDTCIFLQMRMIA